MLIKPSVSVITPVIKMTINFVLLASFRNEAIVLAYRQHKVKIKTNRPKKGNDNNDMRRELKVPLVFKLTPEVPASTNEKIISCIGGRSGSIQIIIPAKIKIFVNIIVLWELTNFSVSVSVVSFSFIIFLLKK
jgi:hypothetical protein